MTDYKITVFCYFYIGFQICHVTDSRCLHANGCDLSSYIFREQNALCQTGMALLETFSTSSIFLKICMVLMPLQTLIYMIGFSTDYWVKKNVSSINLGSIGNVDISFKVYEGLWKVQSCVINQCATADLPNIEGTTPHVSIVCLSVNCYSSRQLQNCQKLGVGKRRATVQKAFDLRRRFFLKRHYNWNGLQNGGRSSAPTAVFNEYI